MDNDWLSNPACLPGFITSGRKTLSLSKPDKISGLWRVYQSDLPGRPWTLAWRATVSPGPIITEMVHCECWIPRGMGGAANFVDDLG